MPDDLDQKKEGNDDGDKNDDDDNDEEEVFKKFSGIADGGVKTVNFTTTYDHCKVGPMARMTATTFLVRSFK